MQQLPGIIQIDAIVANDLMASITQKAMANVPIAILADSISVPHIGNAICEMESQFDNNSSLEKVKLTFSTTVLLPANQHLAFVVKTAEGKQYIIGTAEKPYPTIKLEASTGQVDGDSAVNKYTISYSNIVALVPCTA